MNVFDKFVNGTETKSTVDENAALKIEIEHMKHRDAMRRKYNLKATDDECDAYYDEEQRQLKRQAERLENERIAAAERKAAEIAYANAKHPEYIIYCNAERVNLAEVEEQANQNLLARMMHVDAEVKGRGPGHMDFIGKVAGPFIGRDGKAYIAVRVP